MSAQAFLGALEWSGLLVCSSSGAEVGAESCFVHVLEAAVAVDREVATLEVAEVSAIAEGAVLALKARAASPCGSAGPPVPGSCEEPSANEVAAREVEALEVVDAVIPDAGCFACDDWQAAKR
jgi:hypothetical protein